MIDWLHGLPYYARLTAVILFAVILNSTGFLFTETTEKSLFYFDMIGTAFASLAAGVGPGLIAAILSGWVGSEFAGPQYAVFILVNCVGAIAWGALPRLGRKKIPIFGEVSIGSEIFNPEPVGGYRRKFFSVLIIGFIVGILTSISSVWIQLFIVDPSLNESLTDIKSEYTSHVARNNFAIISVIQDALPIQFQHDLFPILIGALTSNIPDKLMATASAVIIIYSIGMLHNYGKQEDIFRNIETVHMVTSNAQADYTIRGGRILSMFLIVAAATVTLIQASDIIQRSIWVGAAWTFHVLVMFGVVFVYPFSCRSFDRQRHQSGAVSGAFYEWPSGEQMKFQRDVFEDISKIIVVVLTAANGYLYYFAKDNHSALVFGNTGISTENFFISLGIFNITVITAFRYLLVFLMRFLGRM